MSYTTLTYQTGDGNRTLPLLKPIFTISRLNNCWIRVFIPFKYFRKDLTLIQAQEKITTSGQQAVLGKADDENFIDSNALNKDGYNTLFHLANADGCLINLIVVPNEHGWIEIESLPTGWEAENMLGRSNPAPSLPAP